MTDKNAGTEQVSSLNLPNALTVLRLVLVPVFLWLLVLDTTSARWWALGVFVVASYTDHLDGSIARKRNLITNFGKLADPIADKFLTLGAFIVLSVIGELTWWFTVLVAVREIGITVLREILRRRGTVVAASSGGKLKTVLQMLLIVLMVLPWGALINGFALKVGVLPAWASVSGGTFAQILSLGVWLIALAALLITVGSGLQYLSASIASMRDSAR